MLTVTRCLPGVELDSELMALLASTQRHLDVLMLGPMTRTALNHPCHIPDWPTSPSNWPLKLAQLVVPCRVGSKEELEYYTMLINLSRDTLRNLAVHTYTLGQASDVRVDLNHNDDPQGEPLKTLLRPSTNRDSQPKLALANLLVVYQYLRPSTEFLNKSVNFSTLEKLVIVECAGVDYLISSIVEAFRPGLAKLYGLNIQCDWRATKIPGLLRAFGGLQYLIPSFLRYRGEDSLFDIKCLSTHTSTLQDLYFGLGENASEVSPLYIPDEHDVGWLSANMQKLRQLALAMPAIRMDEALSDNEGDFGRSIVSIYHQ